MNSAPMENLLKRTYRWTLCVASSLLVSTSAWPCTTLLVSPPQRRLVGKNYDWRVGHGLVFVNRRGIQKTAGDVQQPAVPMVWTSRYLSVTFALLGLEFPSEGMNEAGLSVDIMVLNDTAYPSDKDPRPAVTRNQWVQYILDTSATVDEAIENAKKVRAFAGGSPLVKGNHYMVCDASSRCAAFEYLKGSLVIRPVDGLPYQALANNTYDASTAHLTELLRKQSESEILQGTETDSLSRFARAALRAERSKSDPSAASDPVSYAFATLSNVAQPGKTQWSIVFDLKQKTVYFRTLSNQQVRSIDLARLRPSCALGAQMIDLDAAGSGDVTPTFAPYSQDAVARHDEMNNIPKIEQDYVIPYPSRSTKCLDGSAVAPS